MSNGRPRPCQTCGVKPKAGQGSLHCYECMPGGPFTPPPCSRCGVVDDYFSGGLCARCHLYAPQRVDSCRDCHAWGATRTNKWLCKACVTWRAEHTMGSCCSCGDHLAINSRTVCRLCFCQARLRRRKHKRLDLPDASRHGAQLFLADMHKQRTLRRQRPQHRPGVTWPDRPVPWRQLVLFTVPVDLRNGRGVVGPPKDHALAIALNAQLDDYAARHRWDWRRTTKVRSGIRILLGLQDTPGAAITPADARLLTDVYLPVRHVLDVLAEVGMVAPDAETTLQRWFDRHTQGLPPTMQDELRTRLDVMAHGSPTPPRRRPRSPTTIRLYLADALPCLHRWADAGHDSLREISGTDVLAVLPPPGPARAGSGQALKSIFGVLKAHKLVFQNPLARISTEAPDRPAPLPVDLDPVREAFHSTNPARAALCALVAFHGLRTGDLRELRLVDHRDGKIHLDRRAIPLAGPVRQRLTAWLDHRQARWPTTTNPHLFINVHSAGRHEPVGRRWIKLTLDLPGSVQALRRDRILHEAIATGGDTRRLCDLFGLSVHAATHYTDSLGHPDLRS